MPFLSNRLKNRRLRTRTDAFTLYANRLMVESLERRGMLSATAGSLGDLAADNFQPASEPTESAAIVWDAGDGSLGLPPGMNFVVCPMANCSENIPSEIAPSLAEGEGDGPDIVDPIGGGLEEDDWLCIFPAAPPTFEPGPNGDEDPTIIIDPVVIDIPQTFDLAELRVQVVSSDLGWAAYYYTCVDSGGIVFNVSVVASYDDPTIAAFVSEHVDDTNVAIIDTGSGWLIDNFPLELAPPLPEKAFFWTDGLEFCDGSISVPAIDQADDFTGLIDPAAPPDVALGPDGGEEPFIVVDPTITDIPETVVFAPAGESDSTFAMSAGWPRTCFPVDGNTASVLDVDAMASVTADSGTRNFAQASSAYGGAYGWMAAFATNAGGADGGNNQPVNGRRRSR